jgi:hypothetical protein
MTLAKFPKMLSACAVLLASALCPRALAQGPLPDAPAPAHPDVLVGPVAVEPPAVETRHRFWDKENRILFAATAALSGADFAVTRANLENGGRELNPVVRLFGTSTPALAANFAGETAGVIAISYLFHRTGHHRLERAVSVVDIGGSSGAVAYGLAHRSVR